jgi:hypothetical protein
MNVVAASGGVSDRTQEQKLLVARAKGKGE